MNKIEEYSIRRILNEFPRVNFIKNDISQLLIGAIIGVVIGIIIKSVI